MRHRGRKHSAGLNLCTAILEITVYALTAGDRRRNNKLRHSCDNDTDAAAAVVTDDSEREGQCVCVTHQIYGFSSAFGGVVTPGLAPQPLLGERLDGHLVDHVVGEVLKTDSRLRKKK